MCTYNIFVFFFKFNNNFFLFKYWKYKFREVNENETLYPNFSRLDYLQKRNDLQASFTAYISVSSAIPNTLFLIINAFISKRFVNK